MPSDLEPGFPKALKNTPPVPGCHHDDRRSAVVPDNYARVAPDQEGRSDTCAEHADGPAVVGRHSFHPTDRTENIAVMRPSRTWRLPDLISNVPKPCAVFENITHA